MAIFKFKRSNPVYIKISISSPFSSLLPPSCPPLRPDPWWGFCSEEGGTALLFSLLPSPLLLLMSERGLEELEEKGQKSEVTDTFLIPLPLCGRHSRPGCLWGVYSLFGGSVWTLLHPGPCRGRLCLADLEGSSRSSSGCPRPPTLGPSPRQVPS